MRYTIRCRRTVNLTVHHRTFERLGAEVDSDLQVLCYFHHMLTHLLEVLCRRCGSPVFDQEGDAAFWLSHMLRLHGIDPDTPVDWAGVPAPRQPKDEPPTGCVPTAST